MAYTPGPQDYVQCPYEKSHIILIEKMQFHLTKCEYVHSSNSPMAECPFNSTHRVRELEMNYHKLHFCQDRHKLENFVFSTQETTPLHPFRTVECTSSENWDNLDEPTYNPTEHCKDKPILMTLQGVTPSERKGFRIVQRKKMQALAGHNAEHREPINIKKSARLPKSEPMTKWFDYDNAFGMNGASGSNMPVANGASGSNMHAANGSMHGASGSKMHAANGASGSNMHVANGASGSNMHVANGSMHGASGSNMHAANGSMHGASGSMPGGSGSNRRAARGGHMHGPSGSNMRAANGSNMHASNGYQTSAPHLQNSEDGQNGFQVPRYLNRGRGRGRGLNPRK